MDEVGGPDEMTSGGGEIHIQAGKGGSGDWLCWGKWTREMNQHPLKIEGG